jgi:hypothetical protein
VLDAEVGGGVDDGCRHLVPHDGDGGAVVLELVAEFALRVERVVLDGDRPQPEDRVEGDDVLRAVRQHEGDAVAGLHAEALEAVRDALDLLAEFAVGHALAEEVEGGATAVPLHARREHLDERLARGLDLVGHALRVGRQPWFR